jgi:tetratricopeptide (TPR) repeat protein
VSGSTNPTQWLPVLSVLAVGALLGAWLVWRLRSSPAAPLAPALPLEVRDLFGRRDALVQQLRELSELRDDTSDEQRAARRQALELEAAHVLLAIEDRGAVPSRGGEPEELPSRSEPAPGSAAAGFFWGLGTAAALAGLLFFVSREAAPRSEGGSVTGGFEAGAAPVGSRAPAGSADAALEQARAALQKRDMMAVWTASQEALRLAPGHPQALSYLSLVRLAMGQPEISEQLLKQALASDPDFAEGYVHLALVYEKSGRSADADKVIADAVQRFPQDAEMIRRAAAEIRRVAAEEPAVERGGPDPHADLPPTGKAAAATAAADAVTGTVEHAGAVPPGAVLFVTARAVGQQGGPPVAVKRLTPRAFPASFTLGPADSMMGQTLPPRLRLEARLDADGDPLSRLPTDPTALLEDVALGTSGVTLHLKAR